MIRVNFFTTILIALIYNAGFSQSCIFSIEGVIVDETTNKPLYLANVYLQETKKGVVTDEEGAYRIEGLCDGSYHLIVSHLGCATQKRFVHIEENKVIDITLEHSENELDHVVVRASKTESLQEQLTINKQKIEEDLSSNLADITEKFTGVGAFKNGSGISKPIIHGLFGNRIAVLNNGIALGGQQWGVDHAPEIDPQAADKISVIKGVGAVKYASSQLGGVVLIEPNPIVKDPNIHGRANTFFETNGLATGVSLQAEQFYKKIIGWKITGTLKNSGDRRAPDYYLTNTGSNQQNLTLQLESNPLKVWKTKLNASFFETEIGILRGARGSSPTDLLNLFEREEPQSTESNLGFKIEEPKQEVKHWFGKWENIVKLNENTSFEGVFALQRNIRNEFDAGRTSLLSIPTLDLDQSSYQFEANWKQRWSNRFRSELGGQYVSRDNVNGKELRDFRLIPDNINSNAGAYGIVKSNLGDLDVEAGFRFSRARQNVVTNRLGEGEMRFRDNFFNYTSSFGLKYVPKHTAYSVNIGYVDRNPTIDERFSNGVHQGVASFERGKVDLENEKAIKATFGIDSHISHSLTFNVLAYYQQFKNYIFLEPSGIENIFFRSLPLFVYQQTNNTVFTGADFSLGYEFSHKWLLNIKGSYLWAQDISNDEPVIFAPANNLEATLVHNVTKPVRFLGKKWQNISFKLNQKYTFEQKRFPFLENFPEFPLPPKGYYLVGAQASVEFPFVDTRLRLIFKGENLLNTKYRDYLNRLRLYADEEGINFNLTAILTF